jgi:hypothetical protein
MTYDDLWEDYLLLYYCTSYLKYKDASIVQWLRYSTPAQENGGSTLRGISRKIGRLL